MKVKVIKRFSTLEKEGKLKFYEVNDNAQEIDEINGEKAIALGYAKKAENKETIQSK